MPVDLNDDFVGQALAPGLPEWNPDQDDVLVCRQVRDETHDVKTFIFSGRTPQFFRYRPGQFLTLDLEIDGVQINRCYTISSAPTRPYSISITVKRVPGGIVSNWLHDNLKPGGEVKALGPAGIFSCLEHPARKYLFLSGGSGVTPLMSMARSFHDVGGRPDIIFVHSARTPADIVFRDELELMARNQPGLRVTHVCEADGAGEPWGGYHGRLSARMLELIAPDFHEREIFTCGPGPYMSAVRQMLGDLGFDMSRYHQESFNFEEMFAEAVPDGIDAPAPDEVSVPRFKVQFTKSRRDVECDAGVNVLDAARMAGMRLPSSCTKGICGTCKSRLLSGSVDMKHQGGIRQREIDQGMILICCSKPLSDLVIER